MMKKAFPTTILPALLTFAVIAAPATAQQMQVQPDGEWCRQEWRDDDHDHDTYCEVRTVTLPATSSFEIDARPNGGVEVEAWDRDEIRVEAKVRTHARRDGEARNIARDVDIEIGSGRVTTDGPGFGARGRGNGWSVSYRVRVPTRTDLEIGSTNGGIAVDGVSGRIDVRTTNGGLSLRDVAGDVRGRSTNGGITARLSGRTWQGPGLDLQTTNGGIVMEIPAGYSARLETGSTHGGYDIDFPVTLEGRVDARRLSVDLGDGGPTIRAVTTNGGVQIRQS